MGIESSPEQTVREVLCNPLGNWGMRCIHPGLKVCSLCREAPTPGRDLEKVELGLWCPDALSLWVQGRAWGGDVSEKCQQEALFHWDCAKGCIYLQITLDLWKLPGRRQPSLDFVSHRPEQVKLRKAHQFLN